MAGRSELGKAAHAIPAILDSVLGLGRPARLRAELRETIDLYGEAASHPELAETASILAATALRQAKLLDTLIGASVRFPQPDWWGLAGALFTATLLWSVVVNLLVPRRAEGWAWFLIVLLGALAALLTLAFVLGAGSLLGPSRRTVVRLSADESQSLLDQIDKVGTPSADER